MTVPFYYESHLTQHNSPASNCTWQCHFITKVTSHNTLHVSVTAHDSAISLQKPPHKRQHNSPASNCTCQSHFITKATSHNTIHLPVTIHECHFITTATSHNTTQFTCQKLHITVPFYHKSYLTQDNSPARNCTWQCHFITKAASNNTTQFTCQ